MEALLKYNNIMDAAKYMTGVQHIGIPTNDIDKTITFYLRLGFTIAYQTVNEKANERVAFLQFGNLIIETYENHAATLRSGAIDHLAIDVKEIDRLYEEIKTAGFHILNDSVQYLPFWEKGVKFFTILGPNEEKVEFCERL